MRRDVHDAPSDLPGDPFLRSALAECNLVLAPAFDEADNAALRSRDRHRGVVKAAAILGNLAVLIAILTTMAANLGDAAIVSAESTIRGAEFVITLIAVGSIAVGVFAQLQQRWYLQRHIAERLSLLKYDALVDLFATSSRANAASFDGWKSRLMAGVKGTAATTAGEMLTWAQTAHTFVHLAPSPEIAENTSSIGAFSAYYCRDGGRLEGQEAYFRERAHRYKATDSRLGSPLPSLFLLSVVLSLAYFVYVLWLYRFVSVVPSASVGAVLTGLAAVVLIVINVLRVLRSSDEYARNTMRFGALYQAIHPLGSRLRVTHDPHQILQTIVDIESLIEEEHREWLRLMIEAEWYS